MKQIYLVFMFIAMSFFGYSQISCPTSIKTTGQSTPSSPIFVVPNGQNGCNEAWPLTITVNVNKIYNFVSCNGGNLQYEIAAGQTPPISFETEIDFGGGLICQYDSDGIPKGLSTNMFEKIKVSITPNPVRDIINIKLNNETQLNNVIIYSISGKQVYSGNNNSKINISNLNSGIYVVELYTEQGTVIKRIVKN